MIGYKDRTWCPKHIWETCSRHQGCYRPLTDKDRKEAEEWWGGSDFPISIFAGKPNCHIPIKVK